MEVVLVGCRCPRVVVESAQEMPFGGVVYGLESGSGSVDGDTKSAVIL